MKRMSTRRQLEQVRRTLVADTVLSRDFRCRGEHLTPVRCNVWSTDCHELGRGQWRQFCYLDPDACIGLCRTCHRWVTEHPLEAIELGLGWDAGTAERYLRDRGRLK